MTSPGDAYRKLVQNWQAFPQQSDSRGNHTGAFTCEADGLQASARTGRRLRPNDPSTPTILDAVADYLRCWRSRSPRPRPVAADRGAGAFRRGSGVSSSSVRTWPRAGKSSTAWSVAILTRDGCHRLPTSWRQSRSTHLGVQAAAGRHVPGWFAFHSGGRGGLLRARLQRSQTIHGPYTPNLRTVAGQHGDRRPATLMRVHTDRPNPTLPGQFTNIFIIPARLAKEPA